MGFDLKGIAKPVHLLDPQDVAHTTTKSSVLDLGTPAAEGVLLGAMVGALTGVDASNYLTLTAQESDTTADADFATVAAASLDGAFTVINSTSKDQVTQFVGYRGTKRYVRVVATFTGTGVTACLISMFAVVGGARVLPVTQPVAVAAT